MAWMLAALLLGGCATRHSPNLTRRLQGTETPGHFVPPFAYEMYLRGELHLQHGEPERAAAALEQALAAPELDPFVLARLALALHLAGHAEAASQRLAQALELAPCTPEAWLVQGRIAEDAGDLNAALDAYAHAVQCRPGHREAERVRQELRARLGLEPDPSPDAAGPRSVAPLRAREAALRQALQKGDLANVRALLGPENVVPPLPWPLRARALSRLGEVEAAARAWRRAAPLREADLADAALDLARAAAWQEAEVAARAALEAGAPPPQADALRVVIARATYAGQDVRGAIQALPPESPGVLAEWLQQAGLYGLAGELPQ